MTHDARPVTPYGVFDLGTWPTKLYGLAVTVGPIIASSRLPGLLRPRQSRNRLPGSRVGRQHS